MGDYMDWLRGQVRGAGEWLFGPPAEAQPAEPAQKPFTDALPAPSSTPMAPARPVAEVLTPRMNFGHRPTLADPARDMALYESEPGRYQFPQQGRQAPTPQAKPQPAKGRPQPAPAPRAQPQPGLDTAAFWRQQDAGRFDAGGAVLADGGPPKVEKATAHYQDTPKNGRACQGCSMFEAPHTCSAVKGFISKRGWCEYWAKGRKAGGRVHKNEVEKEPPVSIEPGDSQWAANNERFATGENNRRLEFDMPGGHVMPDELPGGADAVMPHMNPWAADELMPQYPSWPWWGPNQDDFDRTPRAYRDGGTVEAAAAQVERNPTSAQKEAGNYAKGHLKLHGLDIAIENPKGGTRSGIDKGGKAWSVKMPAHYGYIKRSEGKDGDHVDVYIGPDHNSKRVFVVDQINAESGTFDEHKCMLSYRSKAAALADYKAAFSDGKGADRIGSVAVLSIDSFRDWLKHGNTKKPLGRRAYADGGAIQHSLDRLGSRLPTRGDS